MLDAENSADNQPAENSPETTPTDTPTPDGPAAATETPDTGVPAKKTAKKSAAKKTAAKKTAAKRTTTKKIAPAEAEPSPEHADAEAPAKKAAAKKTTAKKATAKKATAKKAAAKKSAVGEESTDSEAGTQTPPAATALLFQPPAPTKAPTRKKKVESEPQKADKPGEPGEPDQASDADSDNDADEQGGRRRRRRGGRRRRKSGDGSDSDSTSGEDTADTSADQPAAKGGQPDTAEGESATTRRRRRRRRTGDEGDAAPDDPKNTVTRVRKQRSAEDEITAVTGSTRLEAKKQRRREGREAGRRRAPIASEAEFLARREAVDRVMVIRQKKDLTQIAVLEDKVLVEHYVARESQTSLIGNVYLGRVQNVLPSMEAAFIDIGKGRNAVLYAGEVNWDALGAKGGGQRKIEQVLKSGQSVLVQVTKDPIGHKGARLTSQISLPGRFLVYVPDGTTSGISRKLPDTERTRLKTLLKEIVPDTAGVIVRTAAEGASEQELTRDVERLTARWSDIESKVNGSAPQLLYGEPDLTLKVVRDLFTEDFGKLVVSGGDAWDMVDGYVKHVAPELEERLERYGDDKDVFAAYRIDEQIAKGLDRKVWLPSGGSLIIDRTEAMTVVDVNTGKFTGSGGNLEETVTKNNLEAAEEIVRQLRLRDIGGIIVVDFIDMVLESNRDLVLRRMVECLGRDRTRHQVAEVTSLGLVQMTRKRIGTGLLEAFSESCEHCQGRGLIVHHEPLEPKKKVEEEPRRGRRSGRSRGREGSGDSAAVPSPKDVAAMAKADAKPDETSDERHDEQPVSSEHVAQEKKATQEKATQEKATGAKATGEMPSGEVTEEPPAEEKSAKKSGRTRSRSKRMEGPPSVQAPTADPGPVDAAGDETASDVEAGEPAVADKPVAEESVEARPSTEPPSVPAEPAAPTVVSSVRRRGAVRRAAGPPSGMTEGITDGMADGAGPAETAAETPDVTSAEPDGVAPPSDEHETPEPGAAHVPVKKKGSRKH